MVVPRITKWTTCLFAFVLTATSGAGAAVATSVRSEPGVIPPSTTHFLGLTQVSAPPPDGATAIGGELWLTSEGGAINGDSPRRYSVEISRPVLGGPSTPQVERFNQLLAEQYDREASQFVDGLRQLSGEPDRGGPGSFLSLRYQVSAANARLVSLFVEVDGYVEGAAHPYHLTRAVTYDLVEGRRLELSDLFVPASGYLDRLSGYVVDELAPKLDYAFFSEGAQPTAENYRNWNVTPDGLLLVFDEYQVAPYAAGPQRITVPYTQLDDILTRDPRLETIRTP